MTSRRPRVGFIGPGFALDATSSALGKQIEVVYLPVDGNALKESIVQLDGLVEATARIPLDAKLFASALKLRIVSIAGTGSSHVDLEAAARAGVEVRTLFEDKELLEDFNPTAEHTWGLILACARRTHEAALHVLGGGWDRERFPGLSLRGARLGIVGLGRLGRKVAHYGHAFGMDVVAHDRHRDERWPGHVTELGLEELFATSQIITIHLPLDASTAGLIGRPLLSGMRPDAVLVNTSRGAIIDEGSLADAISRGAIAGAALDVLDGEPPRKNHPLVMLAQENSRLLITPHLGGFVPETLRRACSHAAMKVRLHFEAAPPGGAT